MNPLKITSTQPTAATPADPSSTAADSGSNFGPILQAASVSPAPAPTQGQSRSSARNQADGGSNDDSEAAPTPDPASPARTDRTARRGGSDRTGSASQDAAVAVAAACAAAAGVAARADAGPSEGSPATGSATSGADKHAGVASGVTGDPTGAGSPIANARALAAPDAASAAEPAIAAAAGGTLPAQSNANPQTPIDSGRAVTPPAPRVDAGATAVDRTSASQAPLAAVQSKDARSTGTTDDRSDDDRGDADPQGDPGFAAFVPGTVSTSGPSTQAAAHTLSAQVQQAVATAAGNAPSHAADSPTPLLNDPSGNLASTAATSGAGAFGNITAYPADGRTAAVATPVGQPGFGQELSERVVVLARGGVQTAQISLEPAGLGPVGVSIQVHGHAASLVFTAQHETTRNALEAELPRLREMFAASGMQLSDASVGGRAQPQWSAPNQSSSSAGPRDDGGADPAAPGLDEPSKTARPLAVPRLVDTYA
jgi:flagellar hook-length control protein FliK